MGLVIANMDPVLVANPEQKRPATPTPETGSVLGLGIEVHRLTALLLEPVNGHYRLAAWWIAPSRSHRSVADQVQDMCDRFGARMQRQLWDPDLHAPFTASTDAVRRPPLEQVAVTASPRPHVRVWLAGLTPHNSMAAAESALGACHAQIMGTTVLRADADPHNWTRELHAALPEALVLVGGYDVPGPHNPLALLARHVSTALSGLPDDSVPEIVYAGNPFAYPETAALLRADRRCTVTQAANVLPTRGQVQCQPLAQALDDLYWQKCKRMRNFSDLEQWNTGGTPVMTVESSFARLVRLWLELNDLPDLHGVYTCGDRWFHVWADARTDRIMAQFTAAGDHTSGNAWWPPLRLVSGPWTDDADPPSSVQWWDRSGLAPVAAVCANAAPRAAVEALRSDLLVRRDA